MTRLLILSVLAFALTGCGTVANFREELGGTKKPYGGVKLIYQPLAAGDNEAAMGLPFLLCDIPLSAVGDTLTLPVTVPIAFMRAVRESRSDWPFPKDSKPEQLPNWLQDSQPSHLGMTNDPPMTHQ